MIASELDPFPDSRPDKKLAASSDAYGAPLTVRAIRSPRQAKLIGRTDSPVHDGKHLPQSSMAGFPNRSAQPSPPRGPGRAAAHPVTPTLAGFASAARIAERVNAGWSVGRLHTRNPQRHYNPVIQSSLKVGHDPAFFGLI